MSALMHKVDEATGETPYGMIGRIARLDEEQCPRPDFRIPGADAWSGDAFDDRASAVAALAKMTAEHRSERDHVWRGARKRLSQLDCSRLAERLESGSSSTAGESAESRRTPTWGEKFRAGFGGRRKPT